MKDKNKTSVLSLHALVEQAKMIKDCLIKGSIDDLGEILDYGFQQKKMLAKGISTKEIEILYDFIHIYSSQKSYSAAKEDYQCFLLI